MGWCGGSEVAIAMIDAIKDGVSSYEKRLYIYDALIDVLESLDWDTQDEAMGIDQAFDEAMFIKNPSIQEYFDAD